MMDKEDNFELFLGKVLKENALENPPSTDYTQDVMRQIVIADFQKGQQASVKKRWLVVVLGVVQLTALAALVYFIFPLLGIDDLLQQGIDYISGWLPFVPVNLVPWLVGAIGVHAVLTRLTISCLLLPWKNNRLAF